MPTNIRFYSAIIADKSKIFLIKYDYGNNKPLWAVYKTDGEADSQSIVTVIRKLV